MARARNAFLSGYDNARLTTKHTRVQLYETLWLTKTAAYRYNQFDADWPAKVAKLVHGVEKMIHSQ